jgi:DNA topoisomerase-2
MYEREAPVITSAPGSKDFTKITFKPDLSRFEGMTRLDDDIISLFSKRVYDVAGCNTKIKVWLNQAKIEFRSFKDYVKLYFKDPQQEGQEEKEEAAQKSSGVKMLGSNQSAAKLIGPEIVTDKTGLKRWEVVFCTSQGDFQQISFVNSIWTIRGGTHVQALVKHITDAIQPKLKKKNKGVDVKPAMIRNQMFIFVNALINNPEFDSQTKELLKSNQSSWGTKPELSEKFLTNITNQSGLIDKILLWNQGRSAQALKSTSGSKTKRRLGISKLTEANDAAGKHSSQCTLIVTEGDSAKGLALAGLSVVGRDRYGIFPLRGKVLNVRDVKIDKVMDNEELNSIKEIMGLQHDKQYKDVSSLRYGRIMIMTDQDYDGSHIKGLFINFIHHFWPSLSRIPGFLCEFITPIVKVSKGDKTIAFYTLPQYQAWRESNNTRGWVPKYYKGLGTSEPAEMQEYFADLARHKKDFIYTGIKDDEAINLAFLKTNANRRKEWLSACKPGTHLDDALVEIPYHRFINEELILFSREDCERSIPSLMDGFKPGQRKIMYACFKRDLKGEIKIAQLAGYVLENCAYHHGEVSLYSTMVGMAQNFVGANNLNLLEPVGNFGSRDQGGKDAAAARYIFTSLSPLTRYIFHPDDDQVLEYCEDEGMKIEPKWYAPCIPMTLVNSNKGIGTGWSSFVPNYNPRDLVVNIKRLLNGETELKPMHPWYLGFQGRIEWMENKNRYKVSGVWQRVKGQEDAIEITELPIGEWTQDYKDDLELTIKKTDEAEKKAKLEAKKSKVENDDGDSDDNDSKPKTKKTRTKKNAPKEDHEDDDVAATTEKDYGVKKGRKNGFGVAIKDFKEYHTTTRVHFVVTSPEFAKMSDEQIEKALDLTTSISLSNMHLFDAEGRIKKYPSPEEILKEYFIVRFQIYEKRKRALEEAIAQQLKILSNKMRFIKEVIEKTLIVTNRKKDDLFAELKKKGYDIHKSVKSKSSDEEDDMQDEHSKNETNRDYDYLLSMAIWSLTAERYANLADQVAKKQAELDQMRAIQAADLWERDLDVFLDAWGRFEANMKILYECGVGGSAFRKPSSATKTGDDKNGKKKATTMAANQAAFKKLQVLRPINQNSQSVPTYKLGREKIVMPTVKTDPIVPPPKLTKKEREQLAKRSLPEVDEDESLDFIDALPAPKRAEMDVGDDDDDDDIFLPS